MLYLCRQPSRQSMRQRSRRRRLPRTCRAPSLMRRLRVCGRARRRARCSRAAADCTQLTARQQPFLWRGRCCVAAVACYQQLRSQNRRALEGAAAEGSMRVYQLSLQAAGTPPAAGRLMKGFRVCLTIRGVGLLWCDWGMLVPMAGLDMTGLLAAGCRRGIFSSLTTQWSSIQDCLAGGIAPIGCWRE